MARKKSLRSELQRERECRQRVAQARERMNEETIKHNARPPTQNGRPPGRDAAERKRQEQLAHEAGTSVPLPVPVWEDFAPPPPGVLSGLVGGKARHARA